MFEFCGIIKFIDALPSNVQSLSQQVFVLRYSCIRFNNNCINSANFVEEFLRVAVPFFTHFML
jgi:hypothetical protein